MLTRCELENIKFSVIKNLTIENFGAKPFIKWAGGKTQLIPQLKNLYPQELKSGLIKRYVEPFLGGGSVFFDIAQNYKIENAKLFDINAELILLYKVVQKDAEILINFLQKFSAAFLKLSENNRKKYFYELRSNYNHQRFNINYNSYSETWIARAAQTIFLNKTCFNGLYRVNSTGEFNVPFGSYKSPSFYTEENLLAASKVLEIADIYCGDYTRIGPHVTKNSFVYFDPPYRPISKTASFKSYAASDFNDVHQTKLAAFYKKLSATGAKLMLSNSDPKNINAEDIFFDELYADFNIHSVTANRMINSNAAKRGLINEIVVTNY
jgi:DNA adenine methylase